MLDFHTKMFLEIMQNNEKTKNIFSVAHPPVALP